MKYIWFVDNTKLEDIHNIISKTKKLTSTIKKVNDICKKCNGFATTSSEITSVIEEKYNNPNTARIEIS